MSVFTALNNESVYGHVKSKSPDVKIRVISGEDIYKTDKRFWKAVLDVEETYKDEAPKKKTKIYLWRWVESPKFTGWSESQVLTVSKGDWQKTKEILDKRFSQEAQRPD